MLISNTTTPKHNQAMTSLRKRRNFVCLAQSDTTFYAGEMRNVKAPLLFLGLSPLAILI